MDDQICEQKFSQSIDDEIKAFTTQLVQDRIDRGMIDPTKMSFAEMERVSHEIGQRVARGLGSQLTEHQGDLWSDDWCCPTCGIDCEAIKYPRTVQTVDGEAEIVELKSFCPRCRRNFFPNAQRQRPR